MDQSCICTLQLGMGWFPERASGLNRMYYNYTRYLPQLGVEVRGLVAGAADKVQDPTGRVQAFAPSDSPLLQRWWRERQAVRRVLADGRYQLVVSHLALYAFPVLDLLNDLPLVVHFQGPWALEGRVEGVAAIKIWVRRLLEQAVYRRAACFIVLSEAFRDILHQHYQVPLGRIRVVPGGVDIEHFSVSASRGEARAILGWPADRPIVLAVRRLMRRMGLENLIEAMEEVRRQIPDVLLFIAGKGPLESELAARIRAGDLDHHVQLLGFVAEEQLPLAYRAADLSIVPTVALEGFGLSVVESLASGTPAIGTPVGGITEILRPLSENLLLEGSSSQQLAQGLREALSGQRRLPDEEQCRAYTREHFAWPLIARKVRDVYMDVLKGRIG